MPEQVQNPIEEANQNCAFDEQNIDDIFEALDKDINGTLDWKFNMDSYGSQALTELLGPDAWLDDINRHIAQNGQYASFDVTEVIFPLSPGETVWNFCLGWKRSPYRSNVHGQFGRSWVQVTTDGLDGRDSAGRANSRSNIHYSSSRQPTLHLLVTPHW